jgi:hypothetical protein
MRSPLQVNVTQVWLTFSSFIFAFVFVFGNNIRTIYESVIFLFVVHPFDVGDALMLHGTDLWVVCLPDASCGVHVHPILSCPVLSYPVLSCPVLSCPVLSCPVLSCPVGPNGVFCHHSSRLFPFIHIHSIPSRPVPSRPVGPSGISAIHPVFSLNTPAFAII